MLELKPHEGEWGGITYSVGAAWLSLENTLVAAYVVRHGVGFFVGDFANAYHWLRERSKMPPDHAMKILKEAELDLRGVR